MATQVNAAAPVDENTTGDAPKGAPRVVIVRSAAGAEHQQSRREVRGQARIGRQFEAVVEHAHEHHERPGGQQWS